MTVTRASISNSISNGIVPHTCGTLEDFQELGAVFGGPVAVIYVNELARGVIGRPGCSNQRV
jgi:hypothetical protein